MLDYFDDNTEKLLLKFKAFNGDLSLEAINFFKNSCKNDNKSEIYNFFSLFMTKSVRNILVAKPEILNQVLKDKYIEIANFLITETNFSYEELETIPEWNNLEINHKNYIEYCINYKSMILKAISENNIENFILLYNKINDYPKISTLLKLIIEKTVLKDYQDFKITKHILTQSSTKILYPRAEVEFLNFAILKGREDLIKYLIFDYNMPKDSDIELLISNSKEINLKKMFDSRDLFEVLSCLKEKSLIKIKDKI